MTDWVFEARHCPTLLNEIKKTKLDSNTEPQAGINILCAPSMGEGIERYRIIPEGVNPLQASWRSLLVPLKSWIVDKSQCLSRFFSRVRCYHLTRTMFKVFLQTIIFKVIGVPYDHRVSTIFHGHHIGMEKTVAPR